jgi:EpsI family protein
MAARGEETAAVGVRAFEPRTLAMIALTAGAIIAYRSLIGYDPDAEIPDALRGTEGVFFSPTGSSPPIVFGSLLWLMWTRSTRIAAGFGERPLWIVALPCLLAAGGLLLWSQHTGATDLAVLSLLLCFLGAGAWLGGRRSLSPLVVPALFLLLLVPIPSVLLNALLYKMQLLTVALAERSLGLLGVDSIVEGDLIRTSRGVFHVIESCAGFRILMTLLMSSVLYADLFFLPRRRALALFLVTPLLAIAINNLRVLSIVFNPYSKFAAIHSLQGLVMIALGVFAIAAADGLLARILPEEPPRRIRRSGVPWPVGRIAALAAFLAALGIAQWLTPRFVPPPMPPAWTLSNLPLRFEAWTSETQNVDKDFLGSIGFTERSLRRFTSGADQVDVFVGTNDHHHRSGSLISDKTRLPGTGWEIEGPIEQATVGDLTVERFVTRSGHDRQLVYHWRQGVLPVGDEALRSFLALDRSSWRRDTPAVVVRLTTPLDDRGEPAAEQRLATFVPYVRGGLESLDRAAGIAPAAAAPAPAGGGEVAR